MVKISAGLLMYKFEKDKKERFLVFLVHPGGPFWEKKDKGVWGIPKGERDDDSHELFDVAKREFCEETNINFPKEVKFIELGSIKQKNNKIVHAWAFENNEKINFKCESFVEMEYSGKLIRFPEVDKGEFFELKNAKEKILETQWELVERLIKELNKRKGKQTTL